MNNNPGNETTSSKLSSPKLIGALRNNIPNMIWMAAIFIAATAAGYYNPEAVPKWLIADAMETIKKMDNAWRDNLIAGAGAYFGQMALYLYVGFALGIATSIPSVYMMLSTALLTGAIAATKGGNLAGAYPNTIPDALEVAAMWVALSWGAKLGIAWFHKPRLKNAKEAFMEGNMVFLKVVLPLLAAALTFRIVFGTGL